METSRRPLGLRVLNRLGKSLDAVGLPPVRLDDAALLADAERATRLADFGNDAFRAPLRLLVEALREDARLTLLGRMIARTDLRRLLENRLRMVDAWRRHPEILAAPIRRPLFILGLPRTGTTILFELFAQDPANRVPMTWEVMHPFPAPERATFETDPRIDAVDEHFAGIDRLLPHFRKMHPMGARLPQECVALTAHDFATMINHTSHRVPRYQAWLERADLRWVYANHRRQLQFLQWRCPAERWVLKSPGHLWALDALLAEYPDACFVQTHRDPLKVVASLTSLITELRGLASDDVDPHEIGRDWAARLAGGLEHTMGIRARGALPADRIVDVQFADFMRDEVGTVRRIYQHFGWTLSAEAEDRMRRFLLANPADKHGAHRYSLADAGLDLATERRRYAAYQSRHDVPSEAIA